MESERLPDEFGCDIVSHLDAAVQYADLLEERSLTIDFGDYKMSFYSINSILGAVFQISLLTNSFIWRIINMGYITY